MRRLPSVLLLPDLTMGRPKVLYLTPRVPYRLDSGTAIRQFQLLTAYASIADVTLVSFRDADDGAHGDLGPLTRYCDAVHTIPNHTTYRHSTFDKLPVWRQRLVQLCMSRPLPATLGFSDALRQLIEDIASEADLVHVAKLPMAHHVESILGKPSRPYLVLDLDDVETVARFRQLRTLSLPRYGSALLGYLDLLRLARYQRRMLDSFDRILLCSELDKRRLGRPNALVVPNGTTIPASARKEHQDDRTILFCGALSYAPNIDGIGYFVESIWPRILRAQPDARLLIVGKTPSAAVRELARHPRISIHADVPSVDAYYSRSTIAVAPLRMGGGTRLKIIEAFAFDVPVVSTAIGCEGLDVSDGEHLLIARDADEFARHCVTLLRTPALRARLIGRARALVESTYSWPSITASFAKASQDELSHAPHR